MHLYRLFLLPVSSIYGSIVALRNIMFDLKIIPIYQIPKKSICIGNLSVGGTGKTPLVIYLTNLLSKDKSITILSRGYGRSTKGFRKVDKLDDCSEIGDESMQYLNQFGDSVHIAVSEKRVEGVQIMEIIHPETDIYILDDAYQHRYVKAGFNILLTDYSKPFFNDLLLPAGNLREWRKGKNRADCILVTKCPKDLTTDEKKSFVSKMNLSHNHIFFSSLKYGEIVPVSELQIETPKQILLVTGIANPTPLINYLKLSYHVTPISFRDHYAFQRADINRIHRKFCTFAEGECIILTTEKDFMRLKKHAITWELAKYPWYVQPVSILIEDETAFNTLISNYVNTV